MVAPLQVTLASTSTKAKPPKNLRESVEGVANQGRHLFQDDQLNETHPSMREEGIMFTGAGVIS